MYRHRKLRIITISMDDPAERDRALEVLEDGHVALANYISTISDRDRLADLLDPEWRGPLPHTVLIAPGGKVIYRSDGPIKPLEVRRAIVDQLGRTYAAQ
jgi:hypothetical protein